MKYVVANEFYLSGTLVPKGEVIEIDEKLRDNLLEMDVLGEEVREDGDRVAETETIDKASDGADNDNASDETTETGGRRANGRSKK
jgi:hypothetical protein